MRLRNVRGASEIIESADKNAKSLFKAKVKEAKVKADLRVNFAKTSADDALKKNVYSLMIYIYLTNS